MHALEAGWGQGLVRNPHRKEHKMIRNLKALGLALVAVFAMSSVAASFASAALPDVDAIVSEEVPVKLKGTQENGLSKFTLAGQAVECTTANVTATITTSITVEEVLTDEPTYNGCTYAGQGASVNPQGCKYRLTGTTKTDGDAKAHVVCGANPIKLTLNAIACEVFVASQEAEEGYTITTVGSGNTAELTLHVTAKVKVTSKGDPGEGVTCASLTNGNGTLEGTYIVKGENPTTSAQIGITDETLENKT
jgi:hypothetical protein